MAAVDGAVGGAAAAASAATEAAAGAMDSTVTSRPNFAWAEVQPLAARYGDFEFIRMLDSERDQNFLLRRSGKQEPEAVPEVEEERVVLKVHNRSDELDFVTLQNLCLERAAASGARCQRLLRTLEGGEAVVPLPRQGEEGVCQCRMLSFLPGRMLAEVAASTTSADAWAQLLSEVGHSVGKVSASMAGLEHPAARREFPWDLAACEGVIGLRCGYVSGERRPLLEGFLARYRKALVPLLPRLRWSVAHNDPNDYNLVVEPSGSIGVLDFGDLLHTYTCADAAICMAYMLSHSPPDAPLLDSALPFVRGFHAECPLEEAEAEALFGLAVMRVCTSVCMSAYQSSLEPDNEYLLISAKPFWALLERVAAEGAEDAAPKVLRQVCGFAAASA